MAPLAALVLMLAAFSADDEMAWIEAVPTLDWTPVTASENSYFLSRPANPAKVMGMTRMWVRVEANPGQSKERLSLSIIALYEFDCLGGKARRLQSTFYKASNMTGESTTLREPTPWDYSTPGTLGDDVFRSACGLGED